jgi:cytochrome P450
VQNVVPRVAFTGRRPPLHLDPPEHTPYRAVLNPLLAPERVARLEPAVRRLRGSHFLAPLVARRRVATCARPIAAKVPVRVFGRWMQPAGRVWRPNARQARRRPSCARCESGAAPRSMKETSFVLYGMARALIALRHGEPQDPADDPTSAILAARIDGQPIPDAMAVGMVRQVLVVGIVAPMVMTGSIAVHLSRDTALQDQLRRDPARCAAAVEEFLRLYTPYRGFARTARCPVRFGARDIAPGEPIALLYASANRDDSVFPQGERFVADRPNIRDHLAFGRGAHYCAGAALARLELRVMLHELLARTRAFDLDGPVRMSPFPEIGPSSVPLRLSAA